MNNFFYLSQPFLAEIVINLLDPIAVFTSIAILTANLFWMVSSVLWAELIRDIWHYLCHTVPFLWRYCHRWHHLSYRADFEEQSAPFQRAIWCHELPETLLMVLSSLLFYKASHFCFPGSSFGALLGCFYTVRNFMFWCFRAKGAKWALELDANHMPVLLGEVPGQWRVNASGHYRHHFENPNAYYSGVFVLLDKLLGTAMSLKGKTVALVGDYGSLTIALYDRLQRAGATVTLHPNDEVVPSLEAIDILVVTAANYALSRQLVATVTSHQAMTRKEVWVLLSESEAVFSKLSHTVALQRRQAPCIFRVIVTDLLLSSVSKQSTIWQAKAIVKAVQYDHRTVIMTRNSWLRVLYPLQTWLASRYLSDWKRSHLSETGFDSFTQEAL